MLISDFGQRVSIIPQWRPGNQVNGRPASPKSFRKVTPAQQEIATLNLSSEYSSIGTRPIFAVEQVDAEAKHEVPVVREPLADLAGESLEPVIPLSSPALNQDAAERLGLEGIVSDNSFMILRDLETIRVNELHCGPPEQVALITKNGIPTKTDSQVDPVIDSSNKTLLPLDPIELVLDSSIACVEDTQLVTSSQPSDVKAEVSCVDGALSNVDRGSVSNPSKTESMPGVPILDVYVQDQLKVYPSEAHPAKVSLNYGVDDSTPGSIVRLTRKYSLVDVPNKVTTRNLLVEGHLGEDQVAIQEDLISAPLIGCMAVEDNAIVAVPMHSLECCPAYNPAQSHVVSDVAEVDSDPLSLGITIIMGCSVVMLTGCVAFAMVKNANEAPGDDQVLLALLRLRCISIWLNWGRGGAGEGFVNVAAITA
ncbi:hypothetical protein Nepgr_021034 [Nepenthes gracilis]|uniref:Uncharacterized protein n=1 Tax=Nepenthes gracilis TaxID=150966 RepID=A0AAD3SX97_NEPGR|nr:hypothetical protein Nepgr_021034 [Nepenthes gracilis]